MADLKVALKGKTTLTIKIAAVNATEKSKVAADYICDGTADDQEINAAIASLASIGGCIELSEGTFYLQTNGGVNITQNDIWLRGQGNATILTSEDVDVPAGYGFHLNGSFIAKISDLAIKECITGIDVIEGTIIVDSCNIYLNIMEGIYLAENSSACRIINNRILNNPGGQIVDSGTNNIKENNIIT